MSAPGPMNKARMWHHRQSSRVQRPEVQRHQFVPRQVSGAKKRKASGENVGRKAKTAPIVPFPLEELPSELLLMVIAHAPEAVLAMRLTSRKLRSHVDQFVVEQSIVPLVDKVGFKGPFTIMGISSQMPSELSISFEIGPLKSNLFYLHLLLRQYLDFKSEIGTNEKCVDNQGVRHFDKWNKFDVTLDLDDEATVRKHEASMRQWWGRRIGTVALYECYDVRRLELIARILEGKRFSTMNVATDSVTGDLVNHILQAAEATNVDQLRLCGKFNTFDPVIYLPQLASKLRSIHIYQSPCASESDPTVNHFLGANNLDWAELILDLFSSDNKLDKLCIVNQWYPNYLSKAGAERLIDELPRINKRIWFTATCDKFSDMQCLVQDYAMRVRTAADSSSWSWACWKNRCRQFLEIKHTKRADEPAMMPEDLA